MKTEMLVEQAKLGDKEALVQLIIAQQKEYYKLAYIYMGNREDALDAMEDMILLLYENITRLKKTEAFYSWSKTILVNCCKKNLRRKKKVIPMESQQEREYDGGFDLTDEKMRMERHLGQLNEKLREVIKLRYYLDMDYQGIAELMRIPVGTVKSRIHTGLRKLRESFGGEADDR